MKQERENKVYDVSKINRSTLCEWHHSMKNRMDRVTKIDRINLDMECKCDCECKQRL